MLKLKEHGTATIALTAKNLALSSVSHLEPSLCTVSFHSEK